MSESKALDTAQGQVPDLVRTPALEIESEDVALPRLYLGQFMSQAVRDGLVAAGVLFTSLGEDDPNPHVIWEQGKSDPVVAHILGMRKGKSFADGGELTLYEYNDPDAPIDAWVTYNYVISLPEVDPEIPFKWLLTRTATPTAKQINMVLSRNAARGPAHTIAFELTTDKRENQKGEYWVPRARHVEAKAENVEVAERLAVMVSGQTADVQATGDEPAI